MFQAIHVDRCNRCAENRILTLNEQGLGPHGERYNNPILLPYNQPGLIFNDFSYFNNALIEQYFEWVRLALYPDKPSRFKCSYGVDLKDEDPMRWANRPNFRGYPVWLVECEEVFKADSNLLNVFSLCKGLTYFDPDKARNNAMYYWEGKTLPQLQKDTSEQPSEKCSSSPDFELLLIPPIKVIRRVL